MTGGMIGSIPAEDGRHHARGERANIEIGGIDRKVAPLVRLGIASEPEIDQRERNDFGHGKQLCPEGRADPREIGMGTAARDLEQPAGPQMGGGKAEGSAFERDPVELIAM